jgi:hypothetical protein
MGCDIHLFVEKKVEGSWVAADKWEKDKYGGNSLRVDNSFYDDRNYSLFAILADVRNGSGFAGCDLGDGFNPISKPKGLPKDVCHLIGKEFAEWGCDGHSCSWHTLEDLLNYDWTQITKRRGFIDAINYAEWSIYDKDAGDSPKNWCGGVSGQSIRHITEAEMKRRLKDFSEKYDVDGWALVDTLKKTKELNNYYCNIEWKQPYYKTCSSFLSETIPLLLRLGKPNEVRIVFWFDN